MYAVEKHAHETTEDSGLVLPMASTNYQGFEQPAKAIHTKVIRVAQKTQLSAGVQDTPYFFPFIIGSNVVKFQLAVVTGRRCSFTFKFHIL
jgi:hypothetical protein